MYAIVFPYASTFLISYRNGYLIKLKIGWYTTAHECIKMMKKNAKEHCRTIKTYNRKVSLLFHFFFNFIWNASQTDCLLFRQGYKTSFGKNSNKRCAISQGTT